MVLPHSGPTRVRVIDLETTGTQDDPQAEVIEVGCYDLLLGENTILNPWRSFCASSRPVPPETKAVHHITDADLAGSLAFPYLHTHFMAGCGPRDVLGAHNAKFERHFFPGDGRSWICTYKCALTVWPEAPDHGNQVLRYWLNLDDENDFELQRAMPPHRALPDAYVTTLILRRLLAERTVDELIDISSKPPLFHTITFGKYRGMKYADAPGDYLGWIVHRSELDEDTKHSARHWLKQRGHIR